MICVFLLKDANSAIAPAGVNSFSSFVVKNVVAIPHGGKLLNDIAAVGIEDDKARRHPGHNEKPVPALIEGHRIVGECHIRLPDSKDCALLSINDSNFSRLRKIYVDS